MRKAKKENLLGYEIKIIPDGESGYFAVRFPNQENLGDVVHFIHLSPAGAKRSGAVIT